jgi:hypothetical protein
LLFELEMAAQTESQRSISVLVQVTELTIEEPSINFEAEGL